LPDLLPHNQTSVAIYTDIRANTVKACIRLAKAQTTPLPATHWEFVGYWASTEAGSEYLSGKNQHSADCCHAAISSSCRWLEKENQ
jgi:hypothetical protein